MYSSMGVKSGGSVHILDSPLPESGGQDPHKIAATDYDVDQEVSAYSKPR